MVYPLLLLYCTQLRTAIEEYNPNRRKEFLFPGRHGLGHIHKVSADKILRDTCVRLGIEGVNTHSFRRVDTELENYLYNQILNESF
ncbi:hypothetical protein LC609_29940 [Nostoc sp. XA013]|nr:hypothetical protein [Nostoc sp. XA013]